MAEKTLEEIGDEITQASEAEWKAEARVELRQAIAGIADDLEAIVTRLRAMVATGDS